MGDGMRASIFKTSVAALMFFSTGVSAVAAEIKVMSAGAVKPMVLALGEEFARETGHKVEFAFGTVGAMRKRFESGEAADLVVLSVSAIEGMEKSGAFVPGSRIDLGRVVTGVVIREGAPVPDISTVEAFKQALLNARSVAYTDPNAGGSSGTFFVGLVERLGIAEAIGKKAVLRRGGHDVATAVANGEAEIGTTFISEILPVKGAKVAGLLPKEIANVNTYTAAISAKSASREAAAALIGKLTAAATRERWIAAGLEPAFGGK